MKQQIPNPNEFLVPDKCTIERCNDCPIYFDCLSSNLEDENFNICDPIPVDTDLFFNIMY